MIEASLFARANQLKLIRPPDWSINLCNLFKLGVLVNVTHSSKVGLEFGPLAGLSWTSKRVWFNDSASSLPLGHEIWYKVPRRPRQLPSISTSYQSSGKVGLALREITTNWVTFSSVATESDKHKEEVEMISKGGRKKTKSIWLIAEEVCFHFLLQFK